MVEDIEKPQEDIDASFKETVTRAVAPMKTVDAVEKPTMDDGNKTFRTRLVATWMLSNAALSIAISTISNESNSLTKDQTALRNKENFYFKVILWSTFGLSSVRFIGVCQICSSDSCMLLICLGFFQCLYYFFRRNLFRWCRRN